MFSEKRISEIKMQFETQGFVHLKEIIPHDILLHARKAFDIAAGCYLEKRRALEVEEKTKLSFFDIPNILDRDRVFIDHHFTDAMISSGPCLGVNVFS